MTQIQVYADKESIELLKRAAKITTLSLASFCRTHAIAAAKRVLEGDNGTATA